MTGSRTFTCGMCGGTFGKGWPDEEANREAADVWGIHPDEWPEGQPVEVCDPCYRKIDPAKHPDLREKIKREL
jgi:hypothetical protein